MRLVFAIEPPPPDVLPRTLSGVSASPFPQGRGENGAVRRACAPNMIHAEPRSGGAVRPSSAPPRRDYLEVI